MSRKMQNLGQDILILNQKNRVYLEFFLHKHYREKSKTDKVYVIFQEFLLILSF